MTVKNVSFETPRRCASVSGMVSLALPFRCKISGELGIGAGYQRTATNYQVTGILIKYEGLDWDTSLDIKDCISDAQLDPREKFAIYAKAKETLLSRPKTLSQIDEAFKKAHEEDDARKAQRISADAQRHEVYLKYQHAKAGLDDVKRVAWTITRLGVFPILRKLAARNVDDLETQAKLLEALEHVKAAKAIVDGLTKGGD